MALRSNGPLAGIGWLTRAIQLGRHNARPVFGGAAFVLLAALLPTLLTLPMQLGALRAGLQPSGTTMLLAMAISMGAGLLLVPLYAGYLRVIDAAETGRPTRAGAVFAPYREGNVLRFVGYGLVMMIVYFAAFAAVLVAVGGGLMRWYMQVLALQQAGATAVPPALPSGIGLAIALLVALVLWLMGVYAISLGQVALRDRSVFGAIGDGVIGSVKNLLPLVVFSIGLVVAWLVIGIVVGLAFAAVALLGKVVGIWLTVVLAIPLYLALVLALFVVMFGAMYHLWRDVCGDDVAAPGVGDTLAA